MAGGAALKFAENIGMTKKNSCIEIYEIPYTTTSEAIMEEIIKKLSRMAESKILPMCGMETDLNGLKITIDVRKKFRSGMIL